MFNMNKANAAALTDVSDVLSSSAPGANSDHTVTFTLAADLVPDDAGGSTILVEWDTLDTTDEFDFTGIVIGDVDISGSGVDQTLAADCTGAEDVGFVVNTTTDQMTFTICAEATAADFNTGSVVEVQVGTNAAGGTNQINNPVEDAGGGVADIYDVLITATDTQVDTGTALVAVIAGVTVSVTVDESLAFSIVAQTAAQCADYDDTGGTEVTTTATTVPFETPATEAFIDACHELNLDTNAASGYSITVQEDDQLTSGGEQIPDGTCDGACSEATEADWATATNNGFGYCMEDITGTGATNADAGWGTNGCDAADTFFKIFPEFAVDTPDVRTIMTDTTVASHVADIGYRLSVPGTQAAGTYENVITFVATPIFN